MSEYEQVQVPEGFVCDTDAKAMWVCGKIKEKRDNCAYMVEWYEQQIRKITEQTDFETIGLETMLADYFKTVPHKKTKTQESYSFPGGKLILKKQQPEYKRDDKTAIEWLKANGGAQYVKQKEELAWADLKNESCGVIDGKVILREEVTEDGEVLQIAVPGIEVIEREPKFVVEV